MTDKKEAPAAPAKDAAKAPKEKKVTIGSVAMASIIAGKTNEETLKEVQGKFPDAKTSLSSINWYRNKARADKVKGADGKVVPTARDLKKAQKSALE